MDDLQIPVALVRRAVLAGHRGDAPTALGLTHDPHPTVRAAALGALERMGALDTPTLLAAVSDGEATVRRRACTTAGRVVGRGGDPEVVEALVRALRRDPEASVVEAAAWALGEAQPAGGIEALEELIRVANGHDDPLCREAAVAALGAAGDELGLPTVLRALEDKPAIRRRAAVALAAFDGPEADDALRRCLEDRDWQVRQAAEELLREG